MAERREDTGRILKRGTAERGHGGFLIRGVMERKSMRPTSYAAAIQDLVRFYADGRPGMPPDTAKRDYWQRKAKKLN